MSCMLEECTSPPTPTPHPSDTGLLSVGQLAAAQRRLRLSPFFLPLSL